MKGIGCIFIGIIAVVVIVFVARPFYQVNEWEQVIVTRFGERIGEPVTEAGLKFKLPFLDKVNRIEKRVLPWDGDAERMPTKDKTYILVDTFGRWRISDPVAYFENLKNARTATSRLNGILRSETQNAIAKHELIEAIRSTPGRKPEQDENLIGLVRLEFKEIQTGRPTIEKQITDGARPKLAELGIELLDVRFKRVNYNPEVLKQIQERMISERQQIAERFRSEGLGEAAKILGNKEKDLLRIRSEAYKIEQEVRGKADAEAIQIYAEAYNQSPAAMDFYQFLKTMELFQKVMNKDDTVILSTNSDVFRFLKKLDPALAAGQREPAISF